MNKKITGLFLLTAVLLVSLVLALSLDVSSPAELSKSVNSTSFTIRNSEATSLNFALNIPVSISDGTNSVSLSTTHASTFSLAPGATETINIARGAVPSNIKLGLFSSSLIVNAVDPANLSRTDNRTVSLQFRNTFCDYGNVGSGLEITKITDEELDNEDAWKWHVLDNVEITVRVRNNLDDDVDAIVEYGLYDLTDKSFVDLNEDTIDLSLNDGSSEETTIKFEVPSDSDEIDETHDYGFYVKAYEDGDEDAQCTDKKDSNYYQPVTIAQENNEVLLSNVEIQTPLACGENTEITMSVKNTGKNDQDRVLITAYSKDLKLDQKKVLENFDSGDSEKITFTFTVPENTTEKLYPIELKTFFRYDDGNSGCNTDENTACYDDNSKDDLDKTYLYNVKVEGNCKPAVVPDNAQITAVLNSEANAGQEIVVKATVKNIGSSSNSYTVLVSGIDSFATLEKIDPQSLTIAAGQSQDVLVYLKANNDASGDYTFTIRTISGSQIKEQPVSLTIQAKSSLFSGNFFRNIQDNWFIWVVVLINVVLIVLIIVVAVRIARK